MLGTSCKWTTSGHFCTLAGTSPSKNCLIFATDRATDHVLPNTAQPIAYLNQDAVLKAAYHTQATTTLHRNSHLSPRHDIAKSDRPITSRGGKDHSIKRNSQLLQRYGYKVVDVDGP
jgi:hypothetical protein